MLAGRDVERTVIARVVGAAREGRGAALVLRGEPGAGKSALLDEAAAAAAASGARVLRVRGVESESPLGYAALHGLLRPLLPLADRLPPPQRQALRVVMGQAPGEPGDRFLVYLAVLSLLAEAAEEATLLVVADDAHWLDEASAGALLFVARRLESERLALLLGTREEGFDVGDLPVLPIGGLDARGASRLLADRAGGPVPAAVADRLVHGTGGNPLALVELADALARPQLLGTQPLPAELPLTGGVERAFLDRYRRLPPAVRTVVLVAAADDTGRVATLREASRRLGASDEAVDAAERSGLLARHDDRLDVRHPLVRSAVYGAATTSERRRVHGALADALRAPQDADRRAWHRAAATDVPDAAVVAELAAAAERASARGGHEAASAAWARAADLTVAADARAGCLVRAGLAAWVAGQPARAGALADSAVQAAVAPGLRADAALLRARVEWNTGSAPAAHRQVLEEAFAVAPHDPARAREMGVFAASVGLVGHSGSALDPIDLVGAPATPREHCAADAIRTFAHLARGEWREADRAFHLAVTSAGGLGDGLHDLLPNLAMASLHLGDDDLALRLHEQLLAEARRSSALVMVLYALTRRGALDVALGRWDALVTGATESLGLAESTGRRGLTAMPLAWLAAAAALRGEPDAPAALARVEQVAAAEPLGTLESSVLALIRWTRGLLAERPDAALHHFSQLSHGFAERLAALDRIEAAVRADRPDLADRWIADMSGFASGTGAPWAAAVAEHGLALRAGTGDTALEHLSRALAHHERSLRRVDAARSHLAYGELLRRSRRRVEARAHLRTALHTFEDVGARRWAQRAAQELRASGETVSRRGDPDEAQARLTPTEAHVARLVAEGLPTREVAAQLFVSPRTVDFHLRNVFAKLGVTSRAELAHRLTP